jgi:hypothetical protein
MMGSDMMGQITAWHAIIFALYAALVLYPTGRILRRLGFSPLWSVVALFPVVNLIALWVLAMVPWPRDAMARTSSP